MQNLQNQRRCWVTKRARRMPVARAPAAATRGIALASPPGGNFLCQRSSLRPLRRSLWAV